MPPNIETKVRPEINSMLRRLRRRIRQYVLVDACARIVALLGILFWLSFGMNWAYFKLSNLELPVWFRMAFGWGSIVGSLLFAGWLIAPLLRIMRDKALALVLERRFPELDDRLITAAEVAQSRTAHDSDLTAHMLKNTVDEVSRTVDRLQIGDVFERRPRRRALTAAFVMAVSVGALALINLDAMKLWASAYVDFKDVYWDRQTTIIIKVIAQPNDRVKDFFDDDGQPTRGFPGAYKHPRDEELALVVEIPRRAEPVERLSSRLRGLIERLLPLKSSQDQADSKKQLSQITADHAALIADAEALPPESRLALSGRQQGLLDGGLTALKSNDAGRAVELLEQAVVALDERAAQLQANDWKVPTEIDLDYRLAGGRGRTRVTLRQKAKGDRKFLHSVGGLTDSIDALYVKGGDFANRRPYRIVVVEPPRIDRIVLENDYPDYTRRDAYDIEGNPIRDRRVLKGAQTAVPLETNFRLHGFSNKPLVGVRFQVDVDEQNVKQIEVQLKPFREHQPGSVRLIVGTADGGRRTVELPADSAWRFRLIRAEMTLQQRFADVVRAVAEIIETRGDGGNVRQLTPATASDGLKQLSKLAGDSQEIEESYRKLLKEMDRNPVYPRLMLDRMRSSILVPLADVNAEQFSAAKKTLSSLAASAGRETGAFDRTVSARKGMDAMLRAMNQVLDEMSDGARFDVPFHIGSRALELLADESVPIANPIPLPPDREIRIYLEDTDDIIGTSPARLTINGTVDQPPVVETRLRGISTAITRRASIPVTGSIRDDYGLVKARFDFLVDANGPNSGQSQAADQQPPAAEGENANAAAKRNAPAAAPLKWRIRQFRTRPEDNPLEFVLERSPDDRYAAARFEVLPLDLKIGQELTLTVYAEDGDDINGPHHTRGEKYRFRIVSTEELLSLLYGRELGIRRRFEQIIEEVTETRQDLLLHRGRLDEAEKLRAGGGTEERQAQLIAIDDAVANSAGRGFHQVSKNHSETRDVSQSFRELLEELTNNGVHSDEQVRRIEVLIVLPLAEITKNDFPAVLTTVNLFKQAHEKGADPRPRIDDGVAAIDTLLLHMRKVLAEMEDLVKFHEALKDLEAIIKGQSKLEQEAREKQKKDAIEKLKKLGLD